VRVIESIENLLSVPFDLLDLPLAGHPDAQLIVASLLCGVSTIFIFKAASDTAGIRRARSYITAHILEMRIYQNDFWLILRGLGAALAANLLYLRAVAWPLLPIAVLVAIAWAQLEARFVGTPLRPGDAALVTVTCSPGTDLMSVRAAAEYGAVVEPGWVRIPARREVSWRVGVRYRVDSDRPAIFIHVGDASYDLPLAATPEFSVTDGTERSRSAFSGLVHPGLPDLRNDSPIERIAIQYPPARHSLFGWRTQWWVVFAGWSLIGALIPKLLLRIEV